MVRPGAVRDSRVGAAVLVRARTWLVTTQAIFFGALVVCVVMAHGPTAQNDGISFYGVHAPTMPLLIPAYLIAGAGLWRIANPVVAAGAPHAMGTGLRWISVGLVALLVTPYNGGTFLNWAHMTVGVMMAVVQLAVAAWLLGRERSAAAAAAFTVQLAGGIVAALSLPDWHVRLLLVGEIFFEIGFAWCLLEMVASLRRSRAARGL